MKFIEEHINLKLEPIYHSATYIQKISSEIKDNNRIENQNLEKKIHVEINPKKTNLFHVRVRTKSYKLQLDSILKKQEILSKEMASIIDDVKLSINSRGKIITLINHQEIINKWEAIRIQLEKTFVGQAAERYFFGMDKKINDYDKLLLDFKQYRLFGLLWNEMYESYSNIEAKEKIHRIDNMIYHLPITINEKRILDKKDDEKIEIKITGKLTEIQGYYGEIINVLKQKYNTTEDIELKHYGGKYTYNKKTGLLENLNLKMVTTYGEVYQKTQDYHITKAI